MISVLLREKYNEFFDVMRYMYNFVIFIYLLFLRNEFRGFLGVSFRINII